MRILGLTGPSCAGKNHIAAIIEEKGIPVLDLDKLGHIALENRKEEVAARFGLSVLKPDGSIDRRILGGVVFEKAEKLTVLESIVHPEVDKLIEIWLSDIRGASCPPSFCVINAALLHKTALAAEFDAVILVKAPLWLRVLRAKKRDGLSLRGILRRFTSQKHFTRKFLPKNADIIGIKNAGYGLFPRWERRRLEQHINVILKRCMVAIP